MSTTYNITIGVVDDLDCIGNSCSYCAENPAVAELAYTIDEGTERYGETHELCMTCVMPVLGSRSYLAEDEAITLEVHRSATARPF